MANISTQFFGLNLKSPVIAASSSMTANLDQIKKIAAEGPGAIVLKSLFEEEIHMQLQEELTRRKPFEPDEEYMDYFDYIIKEENLNKYTKLISEAKKEIEVPIVASISCVSSSEWTLFARKLEEAGADAIELNLFLIPSDVEKSREYSEQFYFDTVKKVLEVVSIPVTVKISHYFSNLARVIKELSASGVAGITLFNRFYSPDVDIDNETIFAAEALSSAGEYLLPLRWTGIMAPHVDCKLAATTGIHSAKTALKFLLSGASAVQVSSVLYKEGVEAISKMNKEISDWMDAKGYKNLTDFCGKINLNAKNAEVFERAQFMKYFGEKEY